GADRNKDASRREVALQCLLRLLARTPVSLDLRDVLEAEWPLAADLLRGLLAPALALLPPHHQQQQGQQHLGLSMTHGSAMASSIGSRTSTSSSSSSSTAAVGLLLDAFAELLECG
ncbi:hypothetical protein Agub_g13634, partial [Astrephomene gubernaculifera]